MIADILEEHLDEISWLYEHRGLLLRTYDSRLENLEHCDRRWLGHLQGLVGAGEAVSGMVEQGLAEEDPGKTFACVAALSALGGERGREGLEALLAVEAEPMLEALVLGVALPDRPLDSELLAGWLYSDDEPSMVAALRILRTRGKAPDEMRLRSLLNPIGQPDAVLAEALGLAGDLKIGSVLGRVEKSIDSAVPAVRRAALRAAVLLGKKEHGAAWRESLRDAERPGDVLELGVIAGRKDMDALASRLETPALAPAAAVALAWTGKPEVVDRLLPLLERPAVAPLVGHALRLLFGLDVEAQKLVLEPPPAASGAGEPGPEEEDNVDLAEAALGLPVPDAEKVRAWWKDNRSAYAPEIRWRLGRPLARQTTLEILNEGFLGDRGPAALELALTVPEIPVLSTTDLGLRQRSALDAMARARV